MHRFGWVAFVALLAGVAGCDQTTKQLASAELASRSVPIVENVVELRLTHNTDTAFGLLGGVLGTDARWLVLSVATGMVTLGLLAFVILRWRRLTLVARLGGALVIGGAVGNFADRLLLGRVVDFIHVEHWPVFNVADIAVTLGIGALFFGVERAPPVAPEPPAGSTS